jgi:hypothetical protein
MMKNKLLFSLCLVLFSISSLKAQSIFRPDLKNAICGNNWKGKFVSAENTKEDSSEAIMISKTDGGQIVWIDNFTFTNGTIEFDAMGKSGPPQSNFVGVAFRVVDQNIYDAIYFRPFNFRSPNPVNKSHAVQYISQPDWTWQRLRSEYTGKYENNIEPAPDGDAWFHARIVVQKPEVKVYVNNANEPSLIVNELSDRKDGSVGLWCNGFGVIANLKIEQLIDK